MKKLFFFAAAALTLAACTSEELNVQDQQKLVEDNSAVNFDVYAMRGVTRAGTPGTITTTSLQTGTHKNDGFGVFAYYTDSKTYDQNATPNFMFNQQVKWDGTSKWTYEPVKYWPNEFGDAAKADEVDYVSFFAYAPWTEFQVTTGKPVVPENGDVDLIQNKNIVSIKKNSENGDPIVKYVVDTDPATSVDLLWGVNADPDGWAPLDGTVTDATNTLDLPFLNLTKPVTPFDAQGGKIKFNLRHSLAKVKFTIDYIADDNTPDVAVSDNYDPTKAPNLINADETRIYVRWIELEGFALRGALNLNNDEPKKPNWKSYEDGIKELVFPEVIRFNDGRKDGKEGTENGKTKEENMYLNPAIVENFAALEKEMDDTDPDNPVATGKLIFSEDKNDGVKPFVKNEDSQLLFAGDATKNDGFFYVIPRSEEDGRVKMTINYDVLTLDPSLATTLSGTKDLGSQVSNQIWKENILGDVDFEAGKQYIVKIHIGMTSVKIEAVVQDWDDPDPGKTVDVELPDNQPEAGQGGGDTPGGDTPTPAPATIAEALAATPAITSFKYTLVGGSDADVTGTLTDETTEYANTSDPSLNGTYYKFIRSNGTNYVWVKSDAPIDGTTANTILGQSGTSVSGWTLKLAPAE